MTYKKFGHLIFGHSEFTPTKLELHWNNIYENDSLTTTLRFYEYSDQKILSRHKLYQAVMYVKRCLNYSMLF